MAATTTGNRGALLVADSTDYQPNTIPNQASASIQSSAIDGDAFSKSPPPFKPSKVDPRANQLARPEHKVLHLRKQSLQSSFGRNGQAILRDMQSMFKSNPRSSQRNLSSLPPNASRIGSPERRETIKSDIHEELSEVMHGSANRDQASVI